MYVRQSDVKQKQQITKSKEASH